MHDALVADVHRVQSGLAPECDERFARAERGDAQPVHLRERARFGNDLRQCLGRPDWIAGNDQHVVLDAVPQERTAVAREEVVHVLSQLEECERVASVRADELERHLSCACVRRRPRRTARAKEQPGAEDDRRRNEHVDEDRKEMEFVGVGRRGVGPREERDRPVDDCARLGGAPRREPHEACDDCSGSRNRAREGPQQRVLPDTLALDAERVATPPKQRCAAPAQQCFFDIEPLDEVEPAECHEQCERGGPRAPAAPSEVQGGDDQREARRNGDRVEERHGADGHHLQQEVPAPGDVPRTRGGEVDDADRECDPARE